MTTEVNMKHLPKNWKYIAGIMTEEMSDELVKKVLQACNNLDDTTKLAVGSALKYAISHANDQDFIKTYGTVTANVLLGKPTDEG
jgi:hypothetical protein